jgi:hypothetical protein
MTFEDSRAAFLELYIALTKALSASKSTRYDELKECFTNSRKLHGENLTSLLHQWHTEMNDNGNRDFLNTRNERLLSPDCVPRCLSKLCLHKIFGETNFTKSSRANLWLYLQGLTTHAEDFANGKDTTIPSDDILPPAGYDGVSFGSGEDAQLKAVEELTSALPPEVMKKMHKLAESYQDDLTTGKKDVQQISFCNILQDVIGQLSHTDIMSFVENIDGVMKTMQKSQTLPEVQALMKAMQQANVGKEMPVNDNKGQEL